MTDLCQCGFTDDGRRVLGGAFQMADTQGLPLSFSMDQAEKMGCVMSIPHYFASAMEHGWDAEQTFGKIDEALSDKGLSNDADAVKLGCIALFMHVAKTMPDSPATEVGRTMRQQLEQ